MATINLAQGGVAAPPATGAPRLFHLSETLDCAEHNLDADDVVELINIPTGSYVHRVFYEVLEAEGGTLTFDVGDATDPDGFLDGVNGNSEASGVSVLTLTEGAPNTVTGYTAGKLYAATDTLDVTVKNAADAAKIRITAELSWIGGRD